VSDEYTPIQCRACGGRKCKWCGETGVMNSEQVSAWRRFQSGTHRASSPSGRFENPHRVVILERLGKAWDKMPELRIGQLVLEALECANMRPEILRTLDDKRLAEIVEHYVLLGTTRP
jgi:hypothetical protein